ncbi:chemotaxis protein (plasmid) [Arthrobacter sp. FW305-BF8]|uniref:chemotaxis protein n=1 Tax=Arthrobacter sp. FW305-BF8 TaxID=2879617 RepID=UPI001F19408D|nr:chemotaxis protein [Arthrobacter sp. FW305-BF8]UKA56750.1 chemotaxis protein [Arthrobacter sp. FW305-BF8]
MFIVIFLAAFAAIALAGWIIYALTHPVLASQGILIFLCKAAGVIALMSALGLWISQGFAHAIPGFLFMAGLFFVANKLELRWRTW